MFQFKRAVKEQPQTSVCFLQTTNYICSVIGPTQIYFSRFFASYCKLLKLIIIYLTILVSHKMKYWCVVQNCNGQCTQTVTDFLEYLIQLFQQSWQRARTAKRDIKFYLSKIAIVLKQFVWYL